MLMYIFIMQVYGYKKGPSSESPVGDEGQDSLEESNKQVLTIYSIISRFCTFIYL